MNQLSIGNISLDARLAQAALSGYSDLPMRRLAREYGCPYCVNEVVLDKLITQGGKRMRRILAVHPDEHPVAGQLMGSEPEQFAHAADEMVRLGYDAIDINFGCPVKKVLGRCRGGYLLSDPVTARDIIRRVFDAVAGRVPVTVKMRRGMDDEPHSELSSFAILDAAFEIGCAAVTVHGRTVVQRYVGPSRWSFLARVKRHVGNRTILGSGDLFTAADCLRMLHETGVDGVSIARGAIGNPFIFDETRALLAGRPLPDPPTIRDQRAAIERHYALMCEHYGVGSIGVSPVGSIGYDAGSIGVPPVGSTGVSPVNKAAVLFRKFGVRYSELHPCHHDVKMAFTRVKTGDDIRRLLDEWYAPEIAYPPVIRRDRPEALVAAGATLECGA